MSYGCGDDNCTACYEPANYAIVDPDTDEVYDRYVDEATALEMVEDIGRGDDDLYPAECVVEYQPDPKFEAAGMNPWRQNDIDPAGTIPGSGLAENEHGWGRDVWFGDEIGGDEAVSLAYTAFYQRAESDTRTECIDISYYVYGKPGDYGVVEQTSRYFRTDGEREDNEDTADEGQAPSFQTYVKALEYAKSLAMTDQRWYFNL